MNGIVKKLAGWVLLIAGAALVGWSIYSSFNIFLGKKEAPGLFKSEMAQSGGQCPQVSQSGTSKQTQPMQEEVKSIVEGQVAEQIRKIIPPEFITKILNLASWSIFVAILIFAGGQIAGMGARLLKAS
jgi:hypothetical protein